MFPLFRLFTTRKRSLGQGNIFTPVCHSVHGGGSVSVHAGIPPPPGPCTPQDHAPPRDHAPPPGTMYPRDHVPPWTMHHSPGPCATPHHHPPTGTHPTGMQSYFLLLASANKVAEK